ncbi:fumarate reductase/succinate dehydrogenase flavoprotein subunit [Acinetobacter pittii]|uniref:fumarate reductase/succinate dehydrogenase flavoprotein subunit n=1 Tax=Acinetobacter pittii TaxID=48296 RepID=UPI001580C046|nr:fumarate reductase/succinate dehydrogenase flavoprotein subunit [Acinetobacter pittii]NUF44569.1 fumarate reductase/succinate dehydrogenase flavoprotein subunit [Acinetobacter pittii]
METKYLEFDIVVIGGGTAGPMAAIKAKQENPNLKVLLIEKANVKRSGAISMGMDGLNNAVIPGYATPEQYTKEITIANDGVVNQTTVYAYAKHSFTTIQQLDQWGIKFEKDETGEFAVKKVHHMGAYVLPMPEGHDVKKVLYRQLKRAQVKINNRIVTTKLLKNEQGAINGVLGFDCRSGDFYVIKTKAAILCCGAAGRLGLPASGYLMGTYENPTNSGDGYAMAYHAGAELANLECFQINPLIKDYNGPACAYVTGPLGGYTANSKGERFIECDYWSGQMMWEFYQELESGNGPVYLKVDHLAEETIQTIEEILHTNERPSRGRFHEGRGTNYRQDMVEMHISEIGFCSGHSASGVWVNEKAETSVKGLYSAGDMAAVPHNYMLGAFTYGWFAGVNAAQYVNAIEDSELNQSEIEAEKARIFAPLDCSEGLPPEQVEYKLRRFVNDYLQPPKTRQKMEIGLKRFEEIKQDIKRISARNPHEMMRAAEVSFIRDCAEMAARASLFREESRWGLYHYRADFPQKNNSDWFCHAHLKKDEHGNMVSFKKPIEPYVVPINQDEAVSYDRLRIQKDVALAD